MGYRRFALGLFGAAGLCLAGASWAGQLPLPRPIVVELFTSQGCSDCPAADRILSDLAKRNDVIALSFPITYWDMLGWKDTFATESNTKRQKAYAKSMNRSGIYTPQMVVDGVLDVVGNQHDRVMTALTARALASHEPPATISLGVASGRVEIAISAAQTHIKPLATIWVMRTLSQASVNVQSGENKNRHLAYSNVVREMQRAGEWTGEAMKIDLPMTLGSSRQDGIAVILQSHDYGEVLAAAIMPVPTTDFLVSPH